MNNQDKLKKLAEMANIPVQGGRRCAGLGPVWNPLEDINQAYEIVDKMIVLCEEYSRYGSGFFCQIKHQGKWYGEYGAVRAEALCNALLEIPNA